MNLSDAIKNLISERGIEIINTSQFVNILEDVGAFKDEPATSKKVMKGLIDSGFGSIILQISGKRNPNWQNSIRKAVSDYTSKSEYKDELINRIAVQLLFAAGILDELPKVKLSAQKVSQPHQFCIKDSEELLYTLMQEYQAELSELITITTDEFGHKFGYYSTDTNSRLYVLYSKIKLIAKEVGVVDIDSWLTNERRKAELKNRPTTAQIKQALDDVISTLERDYKALMEKGYIVEDDEFGLKSAKLSPNVASDLRSIEKKIIIIGKRRNEDRQLWIDKTKNDFLASKSSPASVRNKVLDRLKNEYLTRLSQLDNEIKSGEIDFTDPTLKDICRKLINLGSFLGKNMKCWCDSENEKVTTKRFQRAAKRKKRNIIISVTSGLVLLICGWQGISYLSSVNARAAFETTMKSANAEYSKGNYIAALGLYQKSENDYDASYLTTSYKGEAHSKAVETTDKILADWENKVRALLQSKQVAQAKAITLALPTNLVLEGSSVEKYKTLSEQVDKDLAIRTTEIVYELLNDIYAHQGKLSESGRQKLEAMIPVVPDNYWLNFIMEKAK